jgi:hypothetical protein
MESKNIYKKLFDLKSKIGKISKDSTNPFFKSKYFDINALLENVEPLMNENGLLLLQPILENKVYSRIYDIDKGEFLESSIELPSNVKPQDMGSAITYYRRYTLQSLLGIQADDDDANKASANKKATTNTQSTATANNEDTRPWLSEKLLNKGLERIEAGEKGVYEKMDAAFKMKKEYRAKLKP